MESQKLLFVVDASAEIGGGHVMRALTLARALQTRGAEVAFKTTPEGHALLDVFASDMPRAESAEDFDALVFDSYSLAADDHRAMAQGIADALKRDPKALVVGVMGAEHVARGYGVVHQLAALGITSVTSLLPWDMDADCKNLQPGLATAVFGVPDLKESVSRPRLGIRIEVAPDGVRVVEISAGSLAEASGLRANDVLMEAAGKTLKLPAELVAIVAGMPAGTWLPLKARRDGQVVELVAKFPPAKP